MGELTQQDIAILGRYVERGETPAYWAYLAAKGDPYARLALGVVRNDTFSGATANRYAKMAAAEQGITLTPELRDKLTLDIAAADLAIRTDLVDKGQGQVALYLKIDDIKAEHATGYAANRLSLDAWTAWPPLQSAFSAGDMTAAQGIWDRIVETGFTNMVVNYSVIIGYGSWNSTSWLGRLGQIGKQKGSETICS